MTPLWHRAEDGVWYEGHEEASILISDADIVALFDAIKANRWCFRRPDVSQNVSRETAEPYATRP